MARGPVIRKLMLATLVLALLASLAYLALRALDERRMAQPAGEQMEARVVVIEPGTSLRGVASALAAAGLLEHPQSFTRVALRRGVAQRLQAGEYSVAAGTTGNELLGMLVEGRVLLHSLTLVEGWTFRQAMAAVQAHPAVTPQLPDADPAAVATAIGLEQQHPEGMLFPDTYRFPRGTSDVALLRQARTRLETELAAAWEARQAGLPLQTAYEALILASIIEKETGAPEERPLIAGVFVNRLRLGMRLQTDPTVIYGLGDDFDGNLRRADLRGDTPYNTYTRAGLPPTPIALAGRAAIDAALNPERTAALYFVATGLGDGRHRFARTLDEHNANVARYILALRSSRRDGTQ
jgi:UPF0755 protein